jgi:hypothetical protein
MDYVTIKLYADTRRMLRIIAATTGEQMVQVMERLCREELEKVLNKNQKPDKNDDSIQGT